MWWFAWSACDVKETLRDGLVRLKYGEPPPCSMRLPTPHPAEIPLGRDAGAWCVEGRRGMTDAVVFLAERRLLVASSDDGVAVVNLQDGTHREWPGTVGVRAAQGLSGARVALGYDSGRVEVRDARGGALGSAKGFGGVRALLEVDGALVVLSRDGVRTRARLPDLAVEARVTAEGSWCGEVSAGGDVWACVPGAMARLGPDLAVVETVPLGFRNPWGSARGPDGWLWVTGDGVDGEPSRSSRLAVFDPADPASLRPILLDWQGTARDVTATPVGAVVGTWGGAVFETDAGAVYSFRAPTQPGRVQSVATSPDGWLEGAPPIVALGKDHGQIDLLYAARD